MVMVFPLPCLETSPFPSSAQGFSQLVKGQPALLQLLTQHLPKGAGASWLLIAVPSSTQVTGFETFWGVTHLN